VAKFQEQTNVYMRIAREIANLSNCVSFKVGAVIVREGRIISTGFNGTPSGYKNCRQVFPVYNKETDRDKHHDFSNMYEIHAEANALVFAAKFGVSTEGATMFVTTQPCMQCSKLIANSGIKAVYYLEPYDRVGIPVEEQRDFFKKCKITFMQAALK